MGSSLRFNGMYCNFFTFFTRQTLWASHLFVCCANLPDQPASTWHHLVDLKASWSYYSGRNIAIRVRRDFLFSQGAMNSKRNVTVQTVENSKGFPNMTSGRKPPLIRAIPCNQTFTTIHLFPTYFSFSGWPRFLFWAVITGVVQQLALTFASSSALIVLLWQLSVCGQRWWLPRKQTTNLYVPGTNYK